MHDYILLFFHALALTVTIETVVLAVFFLWPKFKKLTPELVIRVLIAGVVASSITIPCVWFVFPAIIQNRTIFLVVAELFAFVAEIPIIKHIVKTTWPKAIIASLFANSASFISGFIMGIT